jgi:ParB family transcriptional regulator, chromosome partitioning protein
LVGKFELKYIPLNLIDVSKLNVRTVNREAGISELTQSIKEIGVQQPVVVTKKGDRYELIIGQRRFLAANRAGLHEIPAIIRAVESEKDTLIASFSENIQRMDLDYKDKMQVAERLLSQLGSTEKVAEVIGVTDQTVRNYLGYSIVSEKMKEMVEQKKINAQTAIRISRNVSDEKRAVQIAEKMKEVPTSRSRQLIIDLSKEKPDLSINELTAMVKKKTRFGRVTIDLTPNLADALEKACNALNADEVEITNEALSFWLKQRGFLQ